VNLKFIKATVIIFFFAFTGHAFAKSNEYYKQTVVHMLSECNSSCQKKIFENEVQHAFFILMDAVINQIQFELSQKKKDLAW
tara:strand:+ start:369 stop:614 length:246 start_codon:yes stop_codon:yes gene_type:complete